jgi:flavodoxin
MTKLLVLYYSTYGHIRTVSSESLASWCLFLVFSARSRFVDPDCRHPPRISRQPRQLAESIAKGASSTGATVDIKQIPETLSAESEYLLLLLGSCESFAKRLNP